MTAVRRVPAPGRSRLLGDLEERGDPWQFDGPRRVDG